MNFRYNDENLCFCFFWLGFRLADRKREDQRPGEEERNRLRRDRACAVAVFIQCSVYGCIYKVVIQTGRPRSSVGPR